MEPKVQTSFIPKKSLAASATPQNRGVSLLFIISLAIFLIVSLLAGGVFLYERYLEGAIADKNASLERARAAFEPALIEELKRLSARLTLAKGILENHVTPSSIFTLLEESTLRTIRFRSFSYAAAGQKVTIAMRGEARAFGDMALQSDIFAGTKQLRDQIFANITLDSFSNAVFDYSATVEPALILYRNQRPTTPTPPPPTPTSPLPSPTATTTRP